MQDTTTQTDNSVFFALDIGTRSLIGVVGRMEGERVRVLAMDTLFHSKRAMIDGQIEDIGEVARMAGLLRSRLEERTGCCLEQVYVAAAGRALRTQRAEFELELPGRQRIDEELIGRLEAGAIEQAEQLFEEDVQERQFYLVGYSVVQYYLDNYMMSSLLDHQGKRIRAEIIATFLPAEVVESLYTAMNQAGLSVAGLTLEPIAAMNVAIPAKLRLLNLVMVDIGAGTSDIAACRDGSVTGYTMATVAGDEITETLMKEYLLDFETAEKIKEELDEKETIAFSDILGIEHRVDREEILKAVGTASGQLCQEIADRIVEVNGGCPSAVFLAGGGSRLAGLREGISRCLGLDEKKVAVAGGFYQMHCISEEGDLANPEYATPLGILVSAGLHLIHDNYRVFLNGSPARLFGSGTLTVRDVLMMNGYTYRDMVGSAGKNLVFTLNGERRSSRGTPSEPASLTINGKEAALADLVRPGDSIQFTPARKGQDVRMTAAQAAGISEEDTVILNGEPVSAGVYLNTGDVLVTEPGCAEGEWTEREGASPAAAETLFQPQEACPAGKTDGSEQKPDGLVPSQQDGGRNPAPESVPEQPPASGHVPSLLTASEAAPRMSPSGPSSPEAAPGYMPPGQIFSLNGQDIRLPRKEGGQPYYLMDMLSLTGIDFRSLDRPVTIQVNGREAEFLQPLKENDAIVIQVEE